MRPKAIAWLAATSVIGLVLVGVPYFRTPYQDTDVTALFGLGLLVVIVLTTLSVWLGEVPFVAALLVALGIPVNVVLARIFIDVTADPTSHNLWPFEVVLAGMLGVAVAIPGVLVGLGLRSFAPRR